MSISWYFVDVSTFIPDLGIRLDSDMCSCRHNDAIVARCFAVLRQLRSVSSTVFQTLVTTQLDYGGAAALLQSVPLISGLRRTGHLTDALNCLRWLYMPTLTKFKLAASWSSHAPIC